jgi:hypothetical protein
LVVQREVHAHVLQVQHQPLPMQRDPDHVERRPREASSPDGSWTSGR